MIRRGHLEKAPNARARGGDFPGGSAGHDVPDRVSSRPGRSEEASHVVSASAQCWDTDSVLPVVRCGKDPALQGGVDAVCSTCKPGHRRCAPQLGCVSGVRVRSPEVPHTFVPRG